MTGFGSSCGACKFLRRKCTRDCVFAPYFSYDQAATSFAAVHKVFGASNVSRLLLHLPMQNRSDAAITISFEALARMQDPIYGCVAHIYALQQQVASLQEEIGILGNLMENTTVGVDNCSSGLVNPNNGLEYVLTQNDYHTLDREMNREFPNANELEDHLDPNSAEKFLSGIDQEFFLNHPWFKHSNGIIS
ncbi:LOB domain-containing protein 33-like [Abrus precatorius]|uniref:LOB domain-containing protein 33-like n=1 Tax=Abrus precatorius TaxID=3816 RepID=A0A8B8K2A6_ABRPR|nr:LOB domain-containing protein 33-like [Abrus precatorius]